MQKVIKETPSLEIQIPVYDEAIHKVKQEGDPLILDENNGILDKEGSYTVVQPIRLIKGR